MTIIATDGVSMACDGLATCHGTIVSFDECKIHRLDDGRLVGFAGNPYVAAQVVRWLNDPDGMRPRLDEKEAVEVLILEPGGRVLDADWKLEFLATSPPYAVGSGSVHALAAMDMGASPGEACEMAARRNIYCGGTIQEFWPGTAPDLITRPVAVGADHG